MNINKVFALIALAVIIIVGFKVSGLVFAKAESVSSAAASGGIEALITSQPSK